MSGLIAKSQIPVKSQASLLPDAKLALIEIKNLLKAGGTLRSFGNEKSPSTHDGPPLPALSNGCAYFEKQVGQARADDPKGVKGSKRFVVEVNVASKQANHGNLLYG
jgi:hypothetical protein